MASTPATTRRPLSEELQVNLKGNQRDAVFDVMAVDEDNALEVLATEEGVLEGSFYVGPFGTVDSTIFARDFTIRPKSAGVIGSNRLFEVTVSYRRPDPYPSPKRAPNTAAVYIWGKGESTENIEKDIDGKPIVNGRGEIYQPGPATSIIVVHRTLQIRWYVSEYNMQEILLYDGVANSDEWKIRGREDWKVAIGQVFSHGITPSEQQGDDGLTMMTWDLEFRPGGKLWTPVEVPDYTLDASGNRLLLKDGKVVKTGGDTITVKKYDTLPFEEWKV